MSELVNRHMESMTQEFQEMKRIGLYKTEEIKVIMKTRRDHEYKVNGVSKSLEDYKNYILFEKTLLRQIQLRRDKTKIAERKDGIEYRIYKRVKSLYEIAMQRFSTDLTLYQQYLTFCKHTKFKSGAAKVIQNMLQHFSYIPEVWKIAAHWYAKEQTNRVLALNILDKGLTFHKNSEMLYTEAIKLELSVAKKINVESADYEKNKDIRTLCRKLEVYVELIFDNIENPRYLIEVLSLFEKYGFLRKIQDAILTKLIEKNSDKEFVWNALAEREMKGLHFGEETDDDLVTACFKVFQLGLTKLKGTEKENLWEKYLDCLIKIQKENNEMKDTLKAAFHQASDEKYLKEKYYILWLEFVTDDEAHTILAKGTRNVPQSVDLWTLRLRYAIMSNNTEEIDQVFNEGKEVLKKKSLSLWLMYLGYYCSMHRDDKIESIYQSGVNEDKVISEVLKPEYVKWVAHTKGISRAREIYNGLIWKRPYCKELHLTMSSLESKEEHLDFKTWTKVHQLACSQFGEDDIEVWINFIKFYLCFNQKGDPYGIKVEAICREAENKLNPLLLPDFREKYAGAFASAS